MTLKPSGEYKPGDRVHVADYGAGTVVEPGRGPRVHVRLDSGITIPVLPRYLSPLLEPVSTKRGEDDGGTKPA